MSICLNNEEKQLLLKIARDSISEYLMNGKTRKYNEIMLPPSLLQKAGAFVTYHRKGELRGCVGRFNSDRPLYIIVQNISITSATKDNRFKAIKREELPELNIEISVLSPLHQIFSKDEFDPDQHGIYIKKDGRIGTYLPQVAKSTGWTKEELLGHCARDKAGLHWNDWKEAKLFIYTAQVFRE